MRTVVYIDVLLVINIFINYLLLTVSSMILRARLNKWRLLTGAVLGGLYSLFILLPPIHIFLSVLMKIFMSLSIIIVSFGYRSLRFFLKAAAALFGSSFILAGMMLAIWLMFKPKGMIYNNGALYFDFSFSILFISVTVCYILISIFIHILDKRSPREYSYKTEICVEGKSVEAMSLYDTGNALTEAFSGAPIIIAEYSLLLPIIPKELYSFFKDSSISNYNMPKEWEKRIRVVPFNSVKFKGLLPAFKPDYIKIKNSQGIVKVEKVIVAVTDKNISDGEYKILLNVLINNDLLEERRSVREKAHIKI